MSKIILVFLVLLSFNVKAESFCSFTGCDSNISESLCLEVDWIEGPHIGQMSHNQVKVFDLDRCDYINDLPEEIEFFGWMRMTHHEHGTRPVTTTIIEEEGVLKFDNQDIFFMGGMRGTWFFRVRIGQEVFTLWERDV